MGLRKDETREEKMYIRKRKWVFGMGRRVLMRGTGRDSDGLESRERGRTQENGYEK